ncbi:hypothetical protein TNCV_4275061 [Trichonephila clavipes]|nr:hypothetical protein TNCV_4275061 [Trichonephila clavipes]
MCRDRQGGKKKRSKEPSPTGAAKGQNMMRRIRMDGMRESGHIRGERGLRFGGCCCEPLAAIGWRFARESRCEAPPTKRLNTEGTLVRSLPRKNKRNHEVRGIRIGEILERAESR